MRKMVKIGLIVGLVAVILTGYGGCSRDTGDDTGSSSIIAPLPTQAQVVLSTVQQFTQQVADNNISEAMKKMDFVNDTEKAVNESFYNNPANKPMIDDFLTALKNAIVKKESKNYMILELTSPTIGKYEIWMIKRGNEWKMAY